MVQHVVGIPNLTQPALRTVDYRPDDVVRGEGEAAAVLEEDPVERDDAAAAVVLPDLPEALEREEGDDAQEDGARLLLELEGRGEVASRPGDQKSAAVKIYIEI